MANPDFKEREGNKEVEKEGSSLSADENKKLNALLSTTDFSFVEKQDDSKQDELKDNETLDKIKEETIHSDLSLEMDSLRDEFTVSPAQEKLFIRALHNPMEEDAKFAIYESYTRSQQSQAR